MPADPNAPPPVEEPAKPAKPVTFPNVRVRGIIFEPGRPSALINGRTYFINDRVQEAKVVDINRDYVILELQGEQQSYQLEK